jgi:hypothetical protein
MPQSFMDKILRRARSATSDADLEELKGEMEGKVPPDLMNGEGNGGDDMDDDTDQNGIHMHVHLPNGGANGNGGGEKSDDGPLTIQHDPDDEGDMGGGGDLEARVAALEAQIAQLMDGDESEVELQNPGDAQDAKRYIMRRGSRLKAHDDETIPVPERDPEIIGETDLPGLQGLTQDSVPLELLWQDTMAKGEIIVPGIRIPTFDARVKAGITAQRLCSFRRQTLDAAMDVGEAHEILSGLIGVKTKDQVKTLPCDTLKMAFEATANAIGMQRNNGFVRSSVGDSLSLPRPNNTGGVPSLGEIQRRNREAWKTGEFKPVH